MSEIVLPKKLETGRQYISYSQINSWNSAKSFNLGIKGKFEYILEYFFKEDYGDMGWAEFGQDVENFICFHNAGAKKIKELDLEVQKKNKKYGKNEKLVSESLKSFSKEEEKILKSITPLGVFQQEGLIHFDDFDVLLYIDDATEDFKHIRDYKTASENSSKKYYKDDYWQLDLYSMWVKQEYGQLPEKAEVAIIERAGNCFRGGGRGVLSVKDRVWYHDREINEKRQMILKQQIKTTVQEISDCYKVFLKMKG